MFPFLEKKLKIAFDEKLALSFPKLTCVKDARWPKTPLYRIELDAGGYVFVAIDVAEKYNAYAVELAWAKESKFPWSVSPRSEKDAPTTPNRVRLHTDDDEVRWWNVITGTSGIRDDEVAPDDFSENALMAELNRMASPDPNMPERIVFCVDDTLATLKKALPKYLEAARRVLAK